VLGEQVQQVLETRRVIADPEFAEQPGAGVNHRDIVVVLGPVDSAGCVHHALLSKASLSVGIEPRQDHPAT
jgi:hypothetical protein